MVSNRYNYLTQPPSKTPKGKKDALKASAQKLKHYKQKAERTVSFQTKKKKIYQDIYAKTHNDRNSKPQQKHRLGTVSNILLWQCLAVLPNL